MRRIGVFVCWCGSNIAGVINIDKVLEEIKKHPAVIVCDDYKYLCSEPGQNIIRNMIKEKKLDGIVISACSPSMHENTFRKAVAAEGINLYQCEITNIREQCSWVHKLSQEEATKKAVELTLANIEKILENEDLHPTTVSVTKKALVVGGGIAGMQVALDIADAGFEVILVEKSPAIGGRMAQLSETFPTLDCAQCIITPRTVEVGQHDKIKLMTYSEVEEISGFVGNFDIKIRKKAAYVDREKCTGCGICWEKCPTKVNSEFDVNLGVRKSIYIPYPQAVPNKPVIDQNVCLYFQKGKCRVCEKVCEVKAIEFDQKDEIIEEKVGAIVFATGFDLYSEETIGEYGYGKIKDVITGLQFERLNSASGPTGGEIRRLSDGKVPQEVVFIQCVGSRDPEHGVPYCSKICCMYTAKHAILYKKKVPEGQAYIFYIDIRSGGKGYEEFVQKGIEEEGLLYLRGKVSKVFEEEGKVVVWGADTLTDNKVEIRADMVVLATAMVPSEGTIEISKKFKINSDENGFLRESHVKLRPVETTTMGIFLAGSAQGPKDIPDTVAGGSAAASKVLGLFYSKKLSISPLVAYVIADMCVGCGVCVPACPYDARDIDERLKIAKVNETLCQGCGTCVSACPNYASQLKNMKTEQVFSMIEELI